MKKSIYYFLMMLCMTLVNTSCSNDDGETPDYTVTLTTPEYASEAKAMSGFSIDATHTLGAPKLTAVHITESGEVVFELGDGEEYQRKLQDRERGLHQRVSTACSCSR